MTDPIENFGPETEKTGKTGIQKSTRSKYCGFLKRCAMPILYMSLLFGLVLYMKQEIHSIKQFSQLSIAHEADILTALNNLSSKMDNLSEGYAQIKELKTQMSHMEQIMVTQRSLSGLAKASELQKIAVQLQKFTHLSHVHRIHRIHPIYRPLSIPIVLRHTFPAVRHPGLFPCLFKCSPSTVWPDRRLPPCNIIRIPCHCV